MCGIKLLILIQGCIGPYTVTLIHSWIDQRYGGKSAIGSGLGLDPTLDAYQEGIVEAVVSLARPCIYYVLPSIKDRTSNQTRHHMK